MTSAEILAKMAWYVRRHAIWRNTCYNKRMPTENIIYTCVTDGDTQTCTIPFSNFYNGDVATFNTPFFSAGDLFISLELFILIIFGIIKFISKGVFSVKVHKEYTGVNQPEGKEHYKI